MKPSHLLWSLALCASTGHAQTPWQPPYGGSDTLGGRLEKVYSELLASCGVSNPKLVKKSCGGIFRSDDTCTDEEPRPISSVPLVLQQQTLVPLANRVLWNDKDALGRAFALVYRTNKDYGTAQGDSWLLYKEGLEAASQQMTPQGVSRGLHVHDCAGVLAAAADAGGGLDLPLAHIKAALTASYRTSTRRSVAAAYGRFESPFFKRWSNVASVPDQIWAATQLHNWFTTGEYKGTEVLLQSINAAVSIIDFNEEGRNASSSIDLSGSISAALASATANGKGSIQTSTTISVSRFMVAVPFKGQEPDVQFAKLPTPDDVAKRLLSISPVLDNASVAPAVPGTRVQHKITVPGMAEDYCSDSRRVWTVRATRGDPVYLLSARHLANGDRGGSCEFTVAFDVPGTATSQDAVAIKYQLALTPVTTPTGAQVQPALAEIEVLYPISHSPQIFANNAVVEPTRSGDTWTWKTNIFFREDPQTAPAATVDWSLPIADPVMTIQCTGMAEQTITSAPLSVDLRQKTASVMIELPQSAATAVKVTSAAPARCIAKGRIRFPTKQAGRFLEREFAFPISVPQINRPTT